MSGRFVLPYPRVRIKSMAQGCKDLPPVAGLKGIDSKDRLYR